MLSKKQSIRAPFHNLLTLLSTCLGNIHHKIVLYLPCSLPAREKNHHKVVLYLPCSLPAWEKFTTKLSCTCPALYLPGRNSPQNCLTLALLSTCLGKIHHKIVLHLPCSLPAWEKFTTKLSYTCPALYLPGKNSPQNCLVLVTGHHHSIKVTQDFQD